MKPIEFIGSSRDDLRNFPAEPRRAAGFKLNRRQQKLGLWTDVSRLEAIKK